MEKKQKKLLNQVKNFLSTSTDELYDEGASTSAKKNNKSKQQKSKNTKFHEQKNEDSDNEGALDLTSAYMQSLIKRKGFKKNKEENEKDNNSSQPKILGILKENNSDDTHGFTIIKKRKIRYPESMKTPEENGKEAYQLILKKQTFLAIECLSQAINSNCNYDFRHYFNRSYCYFIRGNYPEALNDINQVISCCDDRTELAKIKCRQGQVYCAMKSYKQAEVCFEECLNLFPGSIAVKSEIMRMKIIQLTSMGYSESDVIDIFNKYPDIKVEEAISHLGNVSNRKSFFKDDFSFIDFKNEKYQTNEDYPVSLTEKFMNAIEMHRCSDDPLWQNSGFLSRRRNTASSASNTQYAASPNRVKAAAPKKVRPNHPNINNKAVWVGPLSNSILDSMLKKKFSKYGSVESVHRLPSSTCAFVNFYDSASAQKALDAETIEINGSLLSIKFNLRRF